MVVAAAWLLAVLPLTQSFQFPPDYVRAAEKIRRVRPSEIGGMPTSVTTALEQRGCTIPQVYFTPTPHNAVRGSFTQRRHLEWAVLCSYNGTSSILVLSEASGAVVAQFAPRSDVGSITSQTDHPIGFARMISVASQQIMRNLRTRLTGRSLPPINHEGICDSLADQDGYFWYWTGRDWKIIAGDDQ